VRGAVGGERVDVLVFVAPPGESLYERLMARGLLALATDLVELALDCPLVGRVIVVTGSDDAAQALGGREGVLVERDRPGTAFHFGRRLLETVERHGVRRPLYFGAGSAPLLGAEGLQAVCRTLLEAEGVVVANNLLSADFFGISTPEALRRVPLPAGEDNYLPALLARQGGLRAVPLEPSLETELDVDTPTDLAVLQIKGGAKPHTRRFLEGAGLEARPLSSGHLERVLPVLVRQGAALTLIGRVATNLWGKVPSELIPGRLRLYVEERGMKAQGREARGEVRSLVGRLLEAVGPRGLFEVLAGFSDAVFFDTRVVFNHLGLRLGAGDRFASDVGDVGRIGDPAARAFTEAALGAGTAVVLGGRNVVAGGLWALAEAAWERADAGLLQLDT
jgi:CTP:molybdopterin cytidylyltransferase MocA